MTGRPQTWGWVRGARAHLATVSRSEWVALGLAAVVYLVVYVLHEKTPGNPLPGSWWNWHDQRVFREAAAALARLSLDPASHHYPIGYPLLGAPFVGLMWRHTFLIPNLLMWLGIVTLLYKVARLWLGRTEALLAVPLVVVACQHVLLISLIPPWSTIPTHLLGYGMVWIYLSRTPTLRRVLLLVLLDGLAYLFRPGDAVYLAPLLVVAVLQVPSWRARVVAALSGMAFLALFPATSALLNLLVFESPTSPYEAKHVAGFAPERLLINTYTFFLDGMPIYRSPEPRMVEHMPWLLAVVPGLIWAARKRGPWVWGAMAPVVACLLLYMAYQNMSPVEVYQFVHYVAWVFPLLGLFAYLTFRHALPELPARVWAPALLVPVALAWFVRLEEVGQVRAVVAEGGRIVPEEPNAALHDLVVLRGLPYTWSTRLERGGRPLRHGLERHYRRNPGLVTTLGGLMVYVADPFRAEELRFTDPMMVGVPVELRSLRWTPTLLPPMVQKLLHGRGWGVDHLGLRLRWDAADLSTRPVEEDAVSHMVSSGPLALTEGEYVVEWFGQARSAGKLLFEVWHVKSRRSLARGWVDVVPSPAEGARLARMTFRVPRQPRVRKTDRERVVELEHEDRSVQIELRMYFSETMALDVSHMDLGIPHLPGSDPSIVPITNRRAWVKR